MNKIITISRQYGSGGREIGKKLSEAFGIPFYDNELIIRAAKESGYSERIFENAEDKATNSLLYSIAMGINTFSNQDMGFTNLSLDDRVYLVQANVIKKIAEEGPCVIVGRCADYVLKDRKDVVHLFIHADLDYRVERATTLYNFPKEKAAENILKIDKRRENYYNYHSNKKWGRVENYHISIQSDYMGIHNSVSCLKNFIELG